MRGFSWLDVRLGLRMLVKYPALTVVGGLGLAVGVALSVGFFSFMRAQIYPVLPLDQGHRIVAVENRDAALNDEERRSLYDFLVWREEVRTIEDLSAFRHVDRTLIAGTGAPELAQLAEMTAAGFRVARVAPLMGRPLLPEDEVAGATDVVVIGYDVWQQHFHGVPDVLGREVRIAGVPHAVVGVMPAGFAFPQADRYWVPLRVTAAIEPRTGPGIFMFGRLAAGATMSGAQAELSALGERMAGAHPGTHAQLRPLVMPYTHSLTDVQGITLWEVAQMQAMMTLLLLMVALNVAVLVYARTASRQQELAVRSALGASRARIIGQLFAEALVLAVAAAVAGVLLAQFGIDLADGIMAAEMDGARPFWIDYSLRGETVLLTVALAILTATMVGVLPGLRATRTGLDQQLRSGAAGGAALGRTWTALVIGQVAIAMAALPVTVAAGWQEVARAAGRPIYDATRFMEAAVAADPAPGDTDVAFGAMLSELMRRLEAEPAVEGVTYRAAVPERGEFVQLADAEDPAQTVAGDVPADAASRAPATARHRVRTMGVGPGVLELFEVPVLAGRGLQPADHDAGVRVVVVNEAFVQQVLGGAPAVGRRLRHVTPEEATGAAGDVAQTWYEIVGVTRNMVENPANPLLVPPAVVHPVQVDGASAVTLALRLRGDATVADVSRRVLEHAGAVDASLRVSGVRSLATNWTQQEFATRLIAIIVLLVLVSVLLLSAAGIYALMSFTVTRRRREVGIRAALGARPRQLLSSVLGRAGAQVAAGVLLGAAVAVFADVAAGGSLLHGHAAIIVAALASIMVCTGLLAALGPARRGLSIQPTEALRADL